MVSKFCNAEEIIEDKKSGFLFDPNKLSESFEIFEKIYNMPDEELTKIKNNSFEKGKMFTSSSLTEVYFKHLIADFI